MAMSQAWFGRPKKSFFHVDCFEHVKKAHFVPMFHVYWGEIQVSISEQQEIKRGGSASKEFSSAFSG